MLNLNNAALPAITFLPNARKRRVVLLEHAPGKLIGYTINLLKCAALAHSVVSENFQIDCIALSAEEYPLERNTNTLNRKDNALLCEIVSHGIDVVGFSVFSWNINYFSRLSRMLKLMAPNCKVIWGGKLATNDYARLAEQNPAVDCFCIGEGELTLQDYLLDHLRKEIQDCVPASSRHGMKISIPIAVSGQPYRALAGTYMRVDGQYYLGPPARLPVLGQLPNPYLEGLIDSTMVSQAYVETLRGCVYSCTFCDWGGKSYRTYDDTFICEVIAKCLALRFDVIFFMDSIFAVQPERRKLFLQTILSHYNGHSRFGFEMFIEHLDLDSVALFHELHRIGGLSKIEIGLQSTNAFTLKAIKRPHKPVRFRERYFDLVRGHCSLQELIQIDLIIALPGETWESYGKGLNAVFSLDPGIISTFPLDVFPGGEMHKHQVEPFGLVFLDGPPYCIISTSTMTAQEIQELMSISWLFVSFRETCRHALFYLHHLLGEDIFGFMVEYARWCEQQGYVPNWYGYGKIEQHFVYLSQFVNYRLASHPDQVGVNRVRQLFLLELAPMMCVMRSHSLFPSLCSNLAHAPGAHDATDSHNESGDGCYAFVLDDVVEFESHPETNCAVLGAIGKPGILLVEIKGQSFRTFRVEISELSKVTQLLPPDRVWIGQGMRQVAISSNSVVA